jgi:hypothetical protein
MHHLTIQLKRTVLVIVMASKHLLKGMLPFVAASVIIVVGMIFWQRAIRFARAENRSRRIGGGLMIFLAALYTLFSLGLLLSLFLMAIGYPKAMRD